MILNIFFDKWINIFFQVDRKILLGALEMSLEYLLLVENWRINSNESCVLYRKEILKPIDL